MRTVTKRAVQGAVAAALAFGGIAVSAGSAHAGSNSWWAGHNYWLTNDITANCVDDSAQYGLRDYECNADSYYSGYQKWHVLQVDGNGYAQLQNDNTGLCMDWSPQYGLRDYSCNQSSFNGGWQKWQIVNRYTTAGTLPSYYQQVLKNGYQAGGNYCLDDSDAYGLRGYPCNGPSQDGGWQGWDIVMDD